MSWRACAHCHRECHYHSVSPSHIAKGPEIEPRHRLVPAVGIMRLVAGAGVARTAMELLLHWRH